MTGTPVEVANCSCGVILVHHRGSETRFLVMRAYNYWDFPKGLMELGEAPIEAALREVLEETGQQELSFPWGTDYYTTSRYAGGKVAHYFLARTRTDKVRLGVNPTLGRPEHQEYRWVTAIEARQLLNERVYGALQWAFEKMTRGAARTEIERGDRFSGG